MQILKLVSHEMTVDALLEMTAVQLADSSTQLRRQQQLSTVVQDSMRESTQETLELARRQVMAGEVAGADSQTANAMSADMQISGAEGDKGNARSPRFLSGGGSDQVSEEMDTTVDNSEPTTQETTTSRSLEIEKRVSASTGASSRSSTGTSSTAATAVSKRPMDADAISRFTTSPARPNKLPRLETSDSVGSTESTVSPRSGTPKESPRPKPPSLLGNILANKAAVAAAAPSPHTASSSKNTAVHYEDLSSASHRLATSDAVKLITSTGGHAISIVRPSHGSGTRNIVMKGEAWVLDK